MLKVHAPDPHCPKVRLLLDTEGQALGAPIERNLWETGGSDNEPETKVETPLDPEEYGIDPLSFL